MKLPIVHAPPGRSERLNGIFSPDRVRYYNFPAACLREDYERTVERYVDRVRRVPGVLGVGRYGNISTPGISDLDLVIVTEDDLPPSAGETLSIGGLPEFERNLFMHEATIMPVNGMGHVSEHLDVSAIDTVWGAVPAVPVPSADERRWHELAILMEWLGCFCRFFGEIATLGVSNVRWALPVLHSLRYSAQIAKTLVGDASDSWTEYPERVAALRSEWFALPSDSVRAERLAACLAEGWTVAADLSWRIEHWIEAEKLLPSLGSGPDWSVYSYEPARFAIIARSDNAEAMIDGVLEFAKPSGIVATARWKQLSRRLAPSWCLLPRFHEAFVMAAASSAPVIHAHAARQWFGGRQIMPMHPTSPFERYLCRRMGRLENQAQFLERNGLGFGSACSDLVYTPPVKDETPESWRRRLLLTAQKTWGTGRVRALARAAGSRYSYC